ncbi:MAG: methyltransferase domain-containing protein [Myxococcales bacterium]|nr:methyltransferase domain-containing protein [Myxococcales bacterium]MDH5307103.1 methyltransferase domain-containing protein [Myxococcales bacterium]MDH5565034.1 methyltransferase domain-containing protein [Myxococcales bacterium]
MVPAKRASEALRLHLGCGPCTPAGWVNVDYALGARLARIAPLRPLLRALGLFRIDWSGSIVLHDLRKPFPWADGSAHAIYSSHTLEHLSARDGLQFLRECQRVLAPGGVIRIVVPDVGAILRDYEKGRFPATELLEHLGAFGETPDDGALRRLLAPLVRFPHRCMYDAASLLERMRCVGLDPRLAPPLVSRIPDLGELEREERTRDSLIAEAQKSDA